MSGPRCWSRCWQGRWLTRGCDCMAPALGTYSGHKQEWCVFPGLGDALVSCNRREVSIVDHVMRYTS